jgi:hypothetical protein
MFYIKQIKQIKGMMKMEFNMKKTNDGWVARVEGFLFDGYGNSIQEAIEDFISKLK